MTRKNRMIISNDDGWIMSNMTSEVTPETIGEMMVDTYPRIADRGGVVVRGQQRDV